MTLPADFQFSQRSLQDYVDCPRRFQLRYVQRLAWPAVEAEPALEHERYLQQGAALHRLIQQHLLGISSEQLSRTLPDEDLRRWWRNYLDTGLDGLPMARYPEVVLSAPAGAHRLVAKMDVVAIDPGRRAVIVDWKTSRKRPRRQWLAKRLQTKVYPYLLVRAGSELNGDRSVQPERVAMAYWFANFPANPERFDYDRPQCQADEAHLISLIDQIGQLGDEDFPLTSDEHRCRFCPYRSLCRRGAEAGTLDQVQNEVESIEDFDFDLDFQQIAEIEY